ncbi:MAG: hypothetical protein Q9224_002113 [Gallowayella concinna]
MSKAATARKRSCAWGKHIMHQPCISQTACGQEERKSGILGPQGDDIESGPDIESLDSIEPVVSFAGYPGVANGGLHQLRGTQPADPIPASPSSTGYEAMRIRFDFDVVKLSGLTAIHVGSATARHIRDKPDRLLEVLRSEQWSYFEYVPSRFGQTRCLDEAICCIAALVRQWITGVGKPDLVALELYSRALRSLQVALNDPFLYYKPDVPCATQIMSIFELLDPGRDVAKIPHTKGVATLIRLRGPQGYQTGFEKSLLLAQAGPLYTDAVQCNTYCFLEEPAWLDTYQSIFFERSASIPFADAYVSLWGIMGAILPLLRNVRSIVRNSREASIITRKSVLSRAFDLRSQLMIMGHKENLAFTKAYGTTTYSFILQEETQSNARLEILGAFAINLMRVERLIVALDSNLTVPMEAHAQQLASQMLALERDAMKTSSRAALFLACKTIAARATLLTASE